MFPSFVIKSKNATKQIIEQETNAATVDLQIQIETASRTPAKYVCKNNFYF